MKPNFNEVFWIINEEMYKPKMKEYRWLDKEVQGNIDYIRYWKIIPVYVKCVSDMYDGTTEFDITPVDVRGSNAKNIWKWSRSVQDKEIDKSVFTTKEKCEKAFNKRFSEEQREKFIEKDSFRELMGAHYG